MKTIKLIPIVFLITGCKLDHAFQSRELLKYQQENPNMSAMSKAQSSFLMDSMGSFSLRSLMNVNIMPIKIYGTAILIMSHADNEVISSSMVIDELQKFGFLHTSKIANWDINEGNPPDTIGNIGFVKTLMTERILGKKVSVEVGNLTCAACHSSVKYDELGNPTNEAWLGSGNSSLNIDRLLNQVYLGLKKGMLNPKWFISKIKEAYPNITNNEVWTIKTFLFPEITKALKNYREMNRVLPFENGGSGHTNGIAAYKRDAKLLDNPYRFHSDEAGFIGIPNIYDKKFRSSLTIDGAYGVIGKERYVRIDENTANSEEHLNDLGQLAAFFTYSAMGTTLKNLEPNIPKAQFIFREFLKTAKPQVFPGAIYKNMALKGQDIFENKCATCHGTYTKGLENLRLVSFPNKLILQKDMGSDPKRWMQINSKITAFTKKTVFSKYVDAKDTIGGYVAPILTGVWSKAPYMHNGSIPTLWQFLNPKLRSKKFMNGGHAIDLENVGIKGKIDSDGNLSYAPEYRPWSTPTLFDTTSPGGSNLGHENQLSGLTLEEKKEILEYLKIL